MALAFVVLAIAAVAALIGWGVSQAGRRRKAIQEWAFRNGFDYTQGPVPAHELAPLRPFQLTDNMLSIDATNVARGSRGVPVTLFDLCRRGRRGVNENGPAYRYDAMALFSMAGHSLPRFSFSALTLAEPGSLTAKMLSGVAVLAEMARPAGSMPVIPIESRPGFLLMGDDAHAVRELFGNATLDFFNDKCGWTVEGDGSWLLVSVNPAIYRREGWPRGALVAPEKLDEFLGVASSIRELFSRQA